MALRAQCYPAILAGLLLAPVAAQAEKEDNLPANDRSFAELISQGYQVVDYEVVDRDEARAILKNRYGVVICLIDEGIADDESFEIESTCYRVR